MLASVFCGLLVAGSTMLLLWPGRREGRFIRRLITAASTAGNTAAGDIFYPQKVRRKFSLFTSRKKPQFDLALVVTEVAARLRAGALPHEAWQITLDRHRTPNKTALTTSLPCKKMPTKKMPTKNMPPQTRKLAEDSGPVWLDRELREILQLCTPRYKFAGLGKVDPLGAGLVDTIPSVTAAVKFSDEVGAALADVLDEVAIGIGEAARAATARRIALAGPQTTVRILCGLPVAGIVLSSLAGVNTLNLLCGTPTGWICLVVGAVFAATGMYWSNILIRKAGVTP